MLAICSSICINNYDVDLQSLEVSGSNLEVAHKTNKQARKMVELVINIENK